MLAGMSACACRLGRSITGSALLFLVEPVGSFVHRAVFVLASLAIVLNAFYSDPRVSITGTVIILAGIPLYYFFKGRR